VLNKGQIEQIGRPQELYLRPDNVFVANFMGETNFIPGTVGAVQGERVEVLTKLGPLVSAAAAKGVRQGDTVTVSLRPESIRIGQAAVDGPNSFDGIVHDTAYLGEVAQHQVSVGSNGQETTLKVFELNPKIVARDEARERAKIHFDPTDVVVLKT
jgi:spermidine/putrescine transport system ATP-binding protein